MRPIAFMLFGAVLGAAVAAVLVEVSVKLDAAVTQTYRCDQLAREADARHSAEGIIEHLLRGETEERLLGAIAAAGLQMARVDKRDYVFITAGTGPSTSALEFKLSGGKVVDLSALPGGPPCGQPQPTDPLTRQ